MLELFAEALDLPSDWFFEKFYKHMSALRTINYPSQTFQSNNNFSIRASPHTDYGIFTILLPGGSDSTGLQILNKNNEWLDVNFNNNDNFFIVNIGDMMARWTNDIWRSTIHRVINPSVNKLYNNNRRQSIAFFFNPNPDQVVDTISTCIDHNHPKKYDSIIAKEYLLNKHNNANID